MMCQFHLAFHVGSQDPNSDPNTSVVGTKWTELFPIPPKKLTLNWQNHFCKFFTK